MARLTAPQRKRLPASKFAGPGRSFPINDKNHARAALSEIRYAPSGSKAKIRAMARRVLGTTKRKRGM